MFSVDIRVTCVKCGVKRELPDSDGTSRHPAMSPDGTTTLDAETRCRCGGKRIRVELEFD